MADAKPDGPAAPAVTEPQAPPTETPTETGGGNQTGNQSIPYDRFQEVNEKRKAAETELATLKAAQAQAATKAQEEQGKYQELYEAEKEKAEKANAAFTTAQLDSSLAREIAKSVNVVDSAQRENNISGIAKLIDRTSITFTDGTLGGFNEAIEKVKTSFPQMFEDGKTQTNPNAVNNQRPAVGSPNATAKDVWGLSKEDFSKEYAKWANGSG